MKKIFFIFTYILIHNLSFGQFGGDDQEDPDVEQVPIDGGITLLIGSGIAYSVFKLSKKNN